MQDYSIPLDQPFDEQDDKRALFVFPHPDDEIAHSGTIGYLKSLGAKVKLITLSKGMTGETDVRSRELLCAVEKLDVEFGQYNFYGNTWEAVLNNDIKYWEGDSLRAIKQVVENEIMSFKPAVIYTYDTIIGGYGHHEHLLTARTVFDAVETLGEKAFFVKRSICPPYLHRWNSFSAPRWSLMQAS